jgi:hypothetical protein
MVLVDGGNSKVWQRFAFKAEGNAKQRSTGVKPTVLGERK